MFQSIFGIGLLILGTPTFIAMGYDFKSTLSILLPISIFISFFQFYKKKISIDKFINKYNVFCIPFLIVFLIISLLIEDSSNLKIYISLLLILSSLMMLLKDKFFNYEKVIIKNDKFILIFIGTVHGFSNMGGNFLSLFCSIYSKQNKIKTRYFIAYGYLIMGILQYLIIIFFSNFNIDFSKLFYLFLVLPIYFPAQIIFKNINNNYYLKVINFTALVYGFFILIFYFI
tara:strand:- start:535 stop:1221 length:687 start_codon:yes stop_codon:yes gene_type:complete